MPSELYAIRLTKNDIAFLFMLLAESLNNMSTLQGHPRPQRSIENEHMLSGDPDNTDTLFMMY
jgi:hypothetical protein